MPNWGEVLCEIQNESRRNPLDLARRKYLKTMIKMHSCRLYIVWINPED